jgi:hypothetical protein
MYIVYKNLNLTRHPPQTLLHAQCITLLLFHPSLGPALAELKLYKIYSFYSKYIDMNACESSKIYTFIIILLHEKCIPLLLFHPGLGPALAELKVGFFFCVLVESLLFTSTVIVLRSYTTMLILAYSLIFHMKNPGMNGLEVS